MTLDEAKAYLSTLVRDEMRDHTFGDAEVYWQAGREDDESTVAEGYFSLDSDVVTIFANQEHCPDGAEFNGAAARELRAYGLDVRIRRNDGGGFDD